MSLKPCADCHHPVSPKAARCPNCGFPNPAAPSAAPKLLVAAANFRRATVHCRKCKAEIRARESVCPICGVADPTSGPGKRIAKVAVPVGLLLALFGVAFWQAPLIDRLLIGTSQARQPAAARAAAGQRTASDRYPASCSTAAPIVRSDSARSSRAASQASVLILIRDPRRADPQRMALEERYPALRGAYDTVKHGYTASLPLSTVSKLRCEKGVRRIEEI